MFGHAIPMRVGARHCSAPNGHGTLMNGSNRTAAQLSKDESYVCIPAAAENTGTMSGYDGFGNIRDGFFWLYCSTQSPIRPTSNCSNGQTLELKQKESVVTA